MDRYASRYHTFVRRLFGKLRRRKGDSIVTCTLWRWYKLCYEELKLWKDDLGGSYKSMERGRRMQWKSGYWIFTVCVGRPVQQIVARKGLGHVIRGWWILRRRDLTFWALGRAESYQRGLAGRQETNERMGTKGPKPGAGVWMWFGRCVRARKVGRETTERACDMRERKKETWEREEGTWPVHIPEWLSNIALWKKRLSMSWDRRCEALKSHLSQRPSSVPVAR